VRLTPNSSASAVCRSRVPEVVGDEEAREAHVLLKVTEEVEDRRLSRDVECRYGLVGDEHA
jgi:hypothetical protein